jgi:hypothetical protein
MSQDNFQRSSTQSDKTLRRINTQEGVEAALRNEQITRQRVEALEQWAETVGLVFGRGLWGRLSWLLRGK